MKMNPNSRIVHSSLRLFSQPELDFPQSDPKLGILIRYFYSPSHSKQMAEVYYESPIIIAPGKGENHIEIDQVDAYIRSKAIDIASQCRKLSDELTKHAVRLEELACQESLIEFDSNNSSSQDDTTFNDSVIDDSGSIRVQRVKEMNKSHDKRETKLEEVESGRKTTNIDRLKEIARRAKEATIEGAPYRDFKGR